MCRLVSLSVVHLFVRLCRLRLCTMRRSKPRFDAKIDPFLRKMLDKYPASISLLWIDPRQVFSPEHRDIRYELLAQKPFL